MGCVRCHTRSYLDADIMLVLLLCRQTPLMLCNTPLSTVFGGSEGSEFGARGVSIFWVRPSGLARVLFALDVYPTGRQAPLGSRSGRADKKGGVRRLAGLSPSQGLGCGLLRPPARLPPSPLAGLAPDAFSLASLRGRLRPGGARTSWLAGPSVRLWRAGRLPLPRPKI